MLAWVIWLIAGAVLVIAEMATLTFYLLWLGIGALTAVPVALLVPESWALQVIVAAVVAVLLTVFTKPLTGRVREARGFRDAIDELVGKQGYVVEDIGEGRHGIVKVGNEMWSATSDEALPQATQVIVVNRGNTVIHVEKWRSV
jgi:membrane protein implicated in regulation of membrane protease activity